MYLYSNHASSSFSWNTGGDEGTTPYKYSISIFIGCVLIEGKLNGKIFYIF